MRVGYKGDVHDALGPAWRDHPVELLTALDGEGRVVITDHGALVVINVYAPAITDPDKAEERMRYKMDFNKVGWGWAMV